MSEKDGGQAFPSESEGHGNPKYHSPGMSLRDYFAAAALTGLSAGFSEEYRERLADGTYGGGVPAKAAYRLADALLKARTQGE